MGGGNLNVGGLMRGNTMWYIHITDSYSAISKSKAQHRVAVGLETATANGNGSVEGV